MSSYLSLPGETNDNASAPSIGAYDFDTDVDLTIEVWFSFDVAPPAARSKIIANNIGNYTTGWSIYVETSGSVIYRYHDGANHTVVFGVAGITTGQKHHLAVTHDFGGNAAILYLDGSKVGSTQTPGVTTGFTATAQLLRVGSDGVGTNPMKGKVWAAVVAEGVATAGAIAAATQGTPAAGTTVVYDADFSAETAGTTSFTEDSSNAATVTVNQSGDPQAEIVSEGPFMPHSYTLKFA